MTKNAPTIQQIAAQLLALHLLDGEKDGTQWLTAIDKAREEIRFNNTIGFDGELLTFTSRFSGKKRYVTKDGCDRETCDCLNGISYHKALFAILAELGSVPKVVPFHKNNHIGSYKSGILTISKCLVCGEVNAISDHADDRARRNNRNCFLSQHEACKAKYRPEQTCKSGQFCWELRSISRSIGIAKYDGYCGTCSQELSDQEMAA